MFRFVSPTLPTRREINWGPGDTSAAQGMCFFLPAEENPRLTIAKSERGVNVYSRSPPQAQIKRS